MLLTVRMAGALAMTRYVRVSGPRGDDVPVCGQCGERHLTQHGLQSCAGHVTHDRESYVPGQDRKKLDRPRPCKGPPIQGGTSCSQHGGSSAHSRAAAERRLAEQRAGNVLRRFGEPADTTPTEALLDAVKWTAGYVAWLRDKVAGADNDDALTQRSSVSGKLEASIWVDLLGSWHDKLVRICTEAIKAGIEERRVRIAEQQGALVADVIRKILADLDLTAEQIARAGEVVPTRLRALAS